MSSNIRIESCCINDFLICKQLPALDLLIFCPIILSFHTEMFQLTLHCFHQTVWKITLYQMVLSILFHCKQLSNTNISSVNRHEGKLHNCWLRFLKIKLCKCNANGFFLVFFWTVSFTLVLYSIQMLYSCTLYNKMKLLKW